MGFCYVTECVECGEQITCQYAFSKEDVLIDDWAHTNRDKYDANPHKANPGSFVRNM